MMRLKKIVVAIGALIFGTNAIAMSMQDLFNNINAQGNTSNPGVIQGQTLNMYSGGSLFMRMPKRTYNLTNITPPSWNAGCGGIDIFAGGFSFINKEQFVALLRNIGSNALGYGFKLALQNLCPTCDNVMQNLQAIANQANRLNIDSCQAAKGIVNASMSDSWDKSKQELAKGFGVSDNVFSDMSDAWTNLMNNEGTTNKALQTAQANHPEAADQIPSGNIVWKALKKIDGIDDDYRMIIMSMIGTVVFPVSDTPAAPQSYPRKEITIETLLGGNVVDSQGHFMDQIQVPIWRCTGGDPDCLNPVEDTIQIAGFRSMVRDKMTAITDKISQRAAYDNPTSTLAFLSATDLPVYKMIAITTTLNNTTMADTMLLKYQELIAAKYAEVYIQRAVLDLRDAIGKQSTMADGTTAEQFTKMRPQLEEISKAAKQTLSTAYAQTVSTYNIALEVQYMERAMNANLSQTLKSSLTFGKSLRG